MHIADSDLLVPPTSPICLKVLVLGGGVRKLMESSQQKLFMCSSVLFMISNLQNPSTPKLSMVRMCTHDIHEEDLSSCTVAIQSVGFGIQQRSGG